MTSKENEIYEFNKPITDIKSKPTTDLSDEIEDAYYWVVKNKEILYYKWPKLIDTGQLAIQYRRGFYRSFCMLFDLTSLAFKDDDLEGSKDLKDLIESISNHIDYVREVDMIDEQTVRHGLQLFDRYKKWLMSKNLVRLF